MIFHFLTYGRENKHFNIIQNLAVLFLMPEIQKVVNIINTNSSMKLFEKHTQEKVLYK